MNDLVIKLHCTRCDSFEDFTREATARSVVRCATCGKRHSADSLHAIDPSEAT